MAKDPAFLMYYKQWVMSTAGWDADIRGWYINLLCHQADKPEGLPTDIESLAELAGVKISQYERFKNCWKHTLAAKFKANDSGKLVNGKLEEVINDRREYSEKQTTRGLIGYFIKLTRHKFNATDEQLNELYKALEVEQLAKMNKQDRLICYKRTLIALLGNVDVDGILNTNTDNEKIKANGRNAGFSGSYKARPEELLAKATGWRNDKPVPS